MRNQSLDAICGKASLDELIGHCTELDAFRRRSENLYERVRALFFLYAIHRFHLPDKLLAATRNTQHEARGLIPFHGYGHLLNRRFEEAINEFLAVQKAEGPSDGISSALAAAYQRLGFQTLADQVRRSVRSVRGNQWMFRMGHPADHPLRIQPELLQKAADGTYPILRERTPVRMDLSHSGWSDIFFLGMDFPEGARVLNVSIDLGVRGRDQEPRPPVEAYLRVIEEPILRLTSVDLVCTADINNLAEVFDFARDYLGLLKAAVIAAGIVPPGIEGSGQNLSDLLARVAGPGRGLEIVSNVHNIPKGSRLAVSTTLLASLVSVCMRATGQAKSLTGQLAEEERRLVLARALLGEWLSGSGGGWQDSGGLWPGMKLITGVLAGEGDPEFGISRGRLMPAHRIFDHRDASPETRRQLQESLVLVHGGMAQNVGPILEMVTEKYLLRCEAEWKSRLEMMGILDDIIASLRAGDVEQIGALTTRNFFSPIQTIIPWANNYFTETLIGRVRAEFADKFWGFWMLGGMSGGGMGFIFAPGQKTAAQARLQELMSQTKRELQTALPFAMAPVVYDFAINERGTWCDLLTGRDAFLPQDYYALHVPSWLRAEQQALSPLRRVELDKFGAACRTHPELGGMVQLLFDHLLPRLKTDGGTQQSLAELLEQSGFDRAQHEQIREDLKNGRIGLAQNRLPVNADIKDVQPEDVIDLTGVLNTGCGSSGAAVPAVTHGSGAAVPAVTHGSGAGVSAVTHGSGAAVSAVTHGSGAAVSAVTHGSGAGVSAVTHSSGAAVSAVTHGSGAAVSAVTVPATVPVADSMSVGTEPAAGTAAGTVAGGTPAPLAGEGATPAPLPFAPFDKNRPAAIKHRRLPHWEQEGVTYFVTFRLGDSLPESVLQEQLRERDEWLRLHGRGLTPERKQEMQLFFREKLEGELDQGHGACVFKDARVADIVESALRHFDGQRYWLGSYVIMPSHVHALVRPIMEHKLSAILHSWKSFTSHEVNKVFQRTGQLWQDESFDRVVRDEHELAKYSRYIAENPVRARLKSGSFRLGCGSAGRTDSASGAAVAAAAVPAGVSPAASSNRTAVHSSATETGAGTVTGGTPAPLTLNVAALRERGIAALRDGELAIITLAAGVGSRWTQGAGVVKALHPFCKLAGEHRTFIETHLAKSRRIGRLAGQPLPHVVTTSYLTHAAIEEFLKWQNNYGYPGPLLLSPGRAIGLRLIPMVRDLRFMWEEMPQQVLDEQQQKVRDSLRHALMNWARSMGEGGDYTDNLPGQCLHPVGHWFEIPNLLRNGVLARLLDERPQLKHLMLHNIDTVGADADPAMFGLHLAQGSCLTFEVIARRIDDRGGGLARVNGQVRLVEGLAMPREEDEFILSYYNSNTCWIDIDKLLAVFGLTREDILRAGACSSGAGVPPAKFPTAVAAGGGVPSPARPAAETVAGTGTAETAAPLTSADETITAALRALAARVPTYITIKDVKKRWGHGQEDIFPVAQFEKLWVDMTALPEIKTSFAVVPRLRGQQLKDQAQLDGWLRDGSAAYVETLCEWK